MPDLGSTELTMLWASCVLGIVYLLAAVVPSVLERGMPWAYGPRDETPALKSNVAGRLDRAWKNFVETFPLFVAAVILQQTTSTAVAGAATAAGLGAIGAQLYFWGRVAFLPLYALGVPFVRTLVWTAALAGIALLLIDCLPGV